MPGSTLDKVRLSDQSQTLRFQPADLGGKAAYRPGQMTFDGQVELIGGPEVKINMRHRLENERGRLVANMKDWTFDNGKAAPQELLPFLKGLVADVEGTIGGTARIDWTPARISSGAEIKLQDLSLATQPAAISGVNGVITLADLQNLRSAGEQNLTVALIDAGLPLVDGKIAFDLPGDRSLRITRADWPLSGGKLVLADVRIPFEGSVQSVEAHLTGVSAATMAAQIDIDGFEAEGTLTGQIPVRINADGPIIDNARIWSEKGGRLRLTSPAAVASLQQSGEMAELLAKALADFRYTDLQVSLDGPLSGEITANAQIKGANPALYNGKRIELNVNLQGALRDLMQSASVIKDLPENIRDRVQGPSGKP